MLFGIGIPPGVNDFGIGVVDAAILPAVAAGGGCRLTAGEVLNAIQGVSGICEKGFIPIYSGIGDGGSVRSGGGTHQEDAEAIIVMLYIHERQVGQSCEVVQPGIDDGK